METPQDQLLCGVDSWARKCKLHKIKVNWKN